MIIRLANQTLTQKKGIAQMDNPLLFLNTTLATIHAPINHTHSEITLLMYSRAIVIIHSKCMSMFFPISNITTPIVKTFFCFS